ncbi:MAG TPA: COX15/CtaA family protein [Streptosporangiaceae bacterium]|nr:COX15/CtaA family protein [Streptosporangiaceae bacterium]
MRQRSRTQPQLTTGPGSAPYGTGLRAVTAASLVLAYLLVILGDTVRVTESGMGCTSWPLCNGHFGLSGSYHALLEQSHRYLAAVVTVFAAASFAAAWYRARQDRLVYRSAAAALALIGVQIVLGAITVLTHNAGWTVALHLAGAWLLAGALTVTVLGVWRAPAVPDPGRPSARSAPAGRLGLAAAVALFALSVTGMLVLHDGASNACQDWPVCGRGTGPAALVVLQYVHRSFALLAAVMITAAALRVMRSASAELADRMLAGGALALLAATAAFGAIVATTGAPPVEQDLHLAVASALWIAVVALATPAAADRAAILDAPVDLVPFQ